MKVLHYDEDTGIFTWIADGRYKRTGTTARTMDSHGYIVVRIEGQNFKAHRLAWLYVFGCLPAGDLDHKNCIRHDNRISNLRIATKSQNAANRPSRTKRPKGICFTKGKWQVSAGKNMKSVYGGRYDTENEASSVFIKLSRRLHGEFTSTNQYN